MLFCNNCQKNLAQDKFDLHFGYCRRNIVKCPQCNIPYDKNMEDQHIEEYHKMENCENCKQSFKKSHYDNHISYGCEKRKKRCEYCDLDVPKQHFQQHVTRCQSRTQKCQICSKGIANKHLVNHIASCTGITQQQKEQNTKFQQQNRYRHYPSYTSKISNFDDFFGNSMNPQSFFNQFSRPCFAFPNFSQKKAQRFELFKQNSYKKLQSDNDDAELQAALLASVQSHNPSNSKHDRNKYEKNFQRY